MQMPYLGANSRGGDMTESQSQKFQTNNDQVHLLAEATNAPRFLPMVSPSYQITVDDWTENFWFRLQPETGSPSLDGDFTLLVPATPRAFAIFNDTIYTCTVRALGSPTGREAVLNAGARAWLYSDGENVEEVSNIYDVAFFVSGSPTFDAVGGLFVAPRAFQIPQSAPGSQGYALTASGAGEVDQVFDIQKNGSSIGSVTFAAEANTATIAFASAVSFAAGDRLAIINPGNPSPDTESTALANIGITLKGVFV